MVFVHRLALLILFAATSLLRADDTAFRSYFTYPDVQITMDFGAEVGHAEAIPFANHTNPTTSTETPVFQSGTQFTGNRPDNPRVQWQFIKKTESGDLYLIAIYQKEHLTKEVPVLYTGSSLVAYDRDHISVTFEPPDSAKWKVR